MMNTFIFRKVPTAPEQLSVNEINDAQVSKAWSTYKMKPEFYDFNRHDMIESIHFCKSNPLSQKKATLSPNVKDG